MNKRKKKLSLLLAAVMLAVSVAACENNTGDTPANDVQTTSAPEESSYDSNTDESEAGEIETLYNPDFRIERLGSGIKKVTDGDGRELILVPKTLSEIPEEYSESIVIRTPVENAVFLSSSQVCTFRTVDDDNIIRSIGGVEGDASSWSDIPAIASALEKGEIANIGSGFGDPDYEQIQALDPDVVFVYSGDYGQQSQMAKFDELGINYAVDNDYLESSYLARMEWMRFVLTFFDADSEADAVMENVRSRVDSAKAAIEGLDKPVVAVFSLFDGTVYPTVDTTWIGGMIADMGGANILGDLSGSSLTYELAYERISTADIIIYSSSSQYTNGLEGITGEFPQITECKAYESGNIYQYSDLFWHGIDQSDVMACDLAAIFYPDVFDGRALSYFIKVGE